VHRRMDPILVAAACLKPPPASAWCVCSGGSVGIHVTGGHCTELSAATLKAAMGAAHIQAACCLGPWGAPRRRAHPHHLKPLPARGMSGRHGLGTAPLAGPLHTVSCVQHGKRQEPAACINLLHEAWHLQARLLPLWHALPMIACASPLGTENMFHCGHRSPTE
jgi:hypothetical protein